MRKTDAYFKAVEDGDIPAINAFLQTYKAKLPDHKRALELAIRHDKTDVVSYLLNANLFNERENQEALGWALSKGRYQAAGLLLTHITIINETSYRVIINKIKHNSQPLSTPSSTLNGLARFITLLLGHTGLEKYPALHLDTFLTLCLKKGLTHVYECLSKEGFSLSKQPPTTQLNILFELMKSTRSMSLIQHIPELAKLVKENLQVVSSTNENLLLIASKHNNVNMMQYLVSLEPNLLNFMQFSLDPLYHNHHQQRNILMATADSYLSAPEAIQWLLSKGLTDDGLLINALTRNPNQIEMLEAYIANLPSENVESLVALSRETPCLLEHILLGQTSFPFESSSMNTADKNNIRLRAIYALTNKLLEATEDKHPSKTHLAARFNQDDDIPSTKYVISPTKTSGSRSLGTIPGLLFNRQSLGITPHRMTIEGPGSVDCHGKTPLHYLAMNAPFHTLQAIKAKVDNLGDHPDKDRLNKAIRKIENAISTKLHENHPLITLKNLLRSGTPINAKDRDGNTALHLAAQHHDADIVNTLCKEGAAVNERNNAGVTSLMLACQYNDTAPHEEQRVGRAVVKTLLSHHADLWVQDHAGKDCYDYLAERRAPNGEDIRALLDKRANTHQFNLV